MMERAKYLPISEESTQTDNYHSHCKKEYSCNLSACFKHSTEFGEAAHCPPANMKKIPTSRLFYLLESTA